MMVYGRCVSDANPNKVLGVTMVATSAKTLRPALVVVEPASVDTVPDEDLCANDRLAGSFIVPNRGWVHRRAVYRPISIASNFDGRSR